MSTIVVFCRPTLRKHAKAAEMMAPRVSVAVACVMCRPGSPCVCALMSSVGREDESAGRNPGAGRDKNVFDVVDLVVRRAADLAHPLGDAVHAVDVRLAQQSAVGVDRQAPAN